MKYLGGKQRLGRHIAPILQCIWESDDELNGYLEPFCGSLGVFKHMTELKHCKTMVANDYHPDLIALWKAVQEDTFTFPNTISEKQYEKAKLLTSPNPMKAFVGFGMSFGGRFFGAYANKYLGDKNEDFCKEMVNSLKRIAPLIQKNKVKFINKSYKSLHPNKKLIYCDPPYAQSNHPIRYRTDTKHYDIFDNEAFWEIMRKWSKTNIVIISETTAPDDFVEIWSMDMYRSAAQSSKTRFKNKNTSLYQNERLYAHSRYAKQIIHWLQTNIVV